MPEFAVYVHWPHPSVTDEVLGAINETWQAEDESFCSAPEDGGAQLSFDVVAATEREAALLGMERARVLDGLLPGRPTKVTVYSDEGQYIDNSPSVAWD